MVDFCAISSWKDRDVSGKSTRMDRDDVAEMEEELRAMGVLDDN